MAFSVFKRKMTMETFVLCKILAMESFDLKATLFSLLFQFRKFTDQDITKNYPHEDTLVNAGRVALALTLLLSFPLLIFPCRAVINKVRNMLDFFLLTKSLVCKGIALVPCCWESETKIWYQMSWLGSNFRPKKITNLTIRKLAIRQSHKRRTNLLRTPWRFISLFGSWRLA